MRAPRARIFGRANASADMLVVVRVCCRPGWHLGPYKGPTGPDHEWTLWLCTAFWISECMFSTMLGLLLEVNSLGFSVDTASTNWERRQNVW